MAEVLGEKEEDILNFIVTYSKWFNSPNSGKYQLFHEKLKVFLLQKLSNYEIQNLHKKLIDRLRIAISEKLENEFELYALAYISDHLLIEAFTKNEQQYGNEIIEYAKNKPFLDRILLISNSFDWSKKHIQNAIHYLSKNNESKDNLLHDEMIHLGLVLIDIYYQEQNDADRIIELFSKGEINLALERIDAFSGLSILEKERQFILYILCLIVLLDSSTRAIDEDSLKKLCFRMNSQISDRLINSKFLPHEFIFVLACGLESAGVNHSLLTTKIKNWDFNWIENYLNFNEINTRVILEIIDSEKNLTNKNKAYSILSIQLNKLNRYDESESVCELITNADEYDQLPF